MYAALGRGDVGPTAVMKQFHADHDPAEVARRQPTALERIAAPWAWRGSTRPCFFLASTSCQRVTVEPELVGVPTRMLTSPGDA